jgi:hypothetical protein
MYLHEKTYQDTETNQTFPGASIALHKVASIVTGIITEKQVISYFMLFTNYLDNNTFITLSIKFNIKYLLPGT